MLTQKQENFSLKFIECGNASEAYRHAYNAGRMKQEVIAVKACELLKNGNVAVRVETLRAEAQERTQITVEDKKLWLKEVIERSLNHVEVKNHEGEGTGEYRFGAGDVIRAVNELNKMDGDHSAVKNEHTGANGEPLLPDTMTIIHE